MKRPMVSQARTMDPMDRRLRKVGFIKDEVEAETEEEQWVRLHDDFDVEDMPSDEEDEGALELNLPIKLVEPTLAEPMEEGDDESVESDPAPMDTGGDGVINESADTEASELTSNGTNLEAGDTESLDETMEIESQGLEEAAVGEEARVEPESPAARDEGSGWVKIADELPPQREAEELGPATRTRSRRVTFASNATEQPYKLNLDENLTKRSGKKTMKEVGLHTLTRLARPFRKTRASGMPAVTVPLRGEAPPRRSSREKRPVRRLITDD